MKQYIFSTALAVALLPGGFVLDSFGAPEKPAARRAIVVQRVKERLGITDEQVASRKFEPS